MRTIGSGLKAFHSPRMLNGSLDASVNFTVTSKTVTPVETGSNGGFVQLDTLDAGKLATGSFDLQFSDGMLKGTFSAEWCAGGTEP